MGFADERRFLFVTGKGGVGKTTVTSALALALSRRGRRVLVVTADAKERVSTVLGVAPFDAELREVAPRVWGVKPSPERALREYGEMILKSSVLAAAVFDSKYTRGFFAGVPGLSEWSVLGKAWFHTTETLPDGSPRFHTVIFDAPATGHGLDMLRVPKVIVDIVPPGVLRRDAEVAWRRFRDPAESGVIVVTLPEDMPATETEELVGSLRGELGLPVAQLVVNAVQDELFSEAERRALLAPSRPLELDRNEPGDEAIAAALRRAIRERVQVAALARLAALGAPTLHLPRLLQDAASPEGVERLVGYF